MQGSSEVRGGSHHWTSGLNHRLALSLSHTHRPRCGAGVSAGDPDHIVRRSIPSDQEERLGLVVVVCISGEEGRLKEWHQCDESHRPGRCCRLPVGRSSTPENIFSFPEVRVR